MKPISITRILLMLCLVFVVAWNFVLPNLASTGKPTAKARTYRRCLDYVQYVRFAATNGGFTLDASRLAEEKDPAISQPGALVRLLLAAEDLSIKGEDYWVKTNCVVSRTNPEVIIVCGKKFDFDQINPSFFSLFSRNYGHAAGYSDGKVKIISTGDFANVDLRGFTRLSQVASNTFPQLFGK